MVKENINEAKYTLIGIFIAYIILCIFIYIFEVCVFTNGEDVSKFHFWTQLITGSSWPGWEGFNENHPLWFSLAVALHIMLNVVPLLGIIWVWLKLLRQRGETMEIANALRLRDMDLKARIKSKVFPKIPQEEYDAFSEMLDDMFEQATDVWKRDLTILVGSERAEKAAEYLRQREV